MEHALKKTGSRMLSRGANVVLVCGLIAGASVPMRAANWFPLGPYGGDARSFAVDARDSQHLYLGTETGWVYESRDGGRAWARLAQIGKRDDLVIDHIMTDPKNPQRLFVGAWIPSRPGGGLFVSENGGKSWSEQEDMRGQSVLSLARSKSNEDEMIAGTLLGVYRSSDDGRHWELISPEGSKEIHEVQSVAIDPMDPQVIYAGTWHLPWKSSDGGVSWKNMKEGIYDDSDVFSIIVDPRNPKLVYASACSGIYKSVDAGGLFKGGVTVNKMQGIPSSARRTRKLAQDPQHPDTVYAGTTEGLYRTLDAGEHWDRMTGLDVIVNDVYIDPANSQHVLLATDRGGVLSSDDGATTFAASNTGFTARQITAFAQNPRNQAQVYVGVVNDKTTGGVFQSLDGGVRWEQMSAGLGGRDVFSLVPTADGSLLAGTAHGVFRWEDGAWSDSSELAAPVKSPTQIKKTVNGKRVAVAKVPIVGPPAAPSRMDSVVFALARSGQFVYAGTTQGLLRGDAEGKLWQHVTALAMPETRFLAVQAETVMVAGLKRIAVSADGGSTWKTVAIPSGLTQVAAIAVDTQRQLWAGGSEGLFVSTDAGTTWAKFGGLAVSAVNGLYFDPVGERVLVTSAQTSYVYAVHVSDNAITSLDTGWRLRFARPVGDHLVGATLFDGLVLQPKMVPDTSLSDTTVSQNKP